jgi:hypothetical protein
MQPNTMHRAVIHAATLVVIAAPMMAQTTPAANSFTSQEITWQVPHTFARYATPSECAEARLWMEQQFWRDKRGDTTYYPRTGLMLQATTRNAINKCSARFKAATTGQHELIGLAQAALAAGNAKEADAALTKLNAGVQTSPVRVKAWALYQSVSVLLEANEPQLSSAERYLVLLDRLGAGAAAERMLAHKRLADVAQVRDSVLLQSREIAAALTAMHEITGDLRKEYAFASLEVYGGLADLKARQGD